MPTGNLDGPAEKHSEQPGRAAIPQSVDGVYSLVASAVGGSALAVVVIHGGFIVGNDTSGSRYLGRLEPRDDGLVNVAITTLQPPGTFGIWGAAESDTLQQREFREVIPLAYFRNGEPFLLPSHGITLIVRRIPDGNAALAAKTGLRLMAAQLEETAQYWDRYDQEAEGKKDG